MRSLYYYLSSKRISVFLFSLVLFFLPFELVPRVDLFGATIRLSQLAALLLILINYKILWSSKKELLKSPWLWLSIFIIIALVSSLFAINPKKGIMTTSFYVFCFALAFTISKVFNLKNSNKYLKIVIGVSLLIVAFCVHQFLGDMLGLSTSLTLISAKYSKLIFGFPRIRGLSIEPLYLANYLIIPLGLSLALVYFRPRKLFYLLLGIFLTTIWLTVARGAYLAIAFMLFTTAVIMLWHKRHMEILKLISIIIFSILLAFILIWFSGKFAKQIPPEQITQTEFDTNIPKEGISAEGNTERLLDHTTDFTSETSFTDRTKTSKTAFELAIDNPLLGVGPGNFGRYVVKAYPETFSDINQIANNETLEILAEIGILGLILIIIFGVNLAWSGIKYKFDKNRLDNNIWFMATGLMLIGFIVQWQTFSTLYITHIWVMIGIYLATIKNPKNIGIK